MDKNSITGILIIVLLWIGMMLYNQHERKAFEAAHPEAKTAKAKSATYPTKEKEEVNDHSNVPVGITDTINKAELAGSFGTFSPLMSGSEKQFTVENEDCKFTFNSKGGILQKVELKKFKTYSKKPLILFDDKLNNQNITFPTVVSNSPVETQNLYFNTTNENKTISGGQKEKVVFTVDLGNGSKMEREFIIPGQGYLFDQNLHFTGFDKIIPKNISYLTMYWNQRMASQERTIDDEQMNATIYYSTAQKDVDDLSTRKDEEKSLSADLSWISYKQHFFNTTLYAKEPFQSGTKIQSARDTKKKYVMDAKSEIIIPFNGAADYTYNIKTYTGPNNYLALKKLGIGIEELVPLGWTIFGWVNKFLIVPVFHFLSKFISSYGIIIFILTLLIKLILTPFTYKSQLSMIKMKVLKPEIDELKKKFGSDQQKFGAAQMELYRKAGVNPMGGCLPMLLQMPILMAMYRFFPSSIELRQQPFLWADDLSSYDSIIHFPTIPLLGDHLSLFTILMAITSFLFTRMSQQSTPGDDSPMAQQMKIMQYFMPFMLIFIFNKLSAAMSYYYFLFNVLSMLQQWGMIRFMIDEDKIHAQIQENKKKPVKAGGFQQKLEKMMKEQQEKQKKLGK